MDRWAAHKTKLVGANQCEAQCCSATLTSNTATGNTDLQAASLSPGDLPVSIKSHSTQKSTAGWIPLHRRKCQPPVPPYQDYKEKGCKESAVGDGNKNVQV